MENKSIKKNLNEIEIYSVTAEILNGEILESFVTLDRKLAVKKAFEMNDFYCEADKYTHIVYIDTWKDNERIKFEYIFKGK